MAVNGGLLSARLVFTEVRIPYPLVSRWLKNDGSRASPKKYLDQNCLFRFFKGFGALCPIEMTKFNVTTRMGGFSDDPSVRPNIGLS